MLFIILYYLHEIIIYVVVKPIVNQHKGHTAVPCFFANSLRIPVSVERGATLTRRKICVGRSNQVKDIRSRIVLLRYSTVCLYIVNCLKSFPGLRSIG